MKYILVSTIISTIVNTIVNTIISTILSRIIITRSTSGFIKSCLYFLFNLFAQLLKRFLGFLQFFFIENVNVIIGLFLIKHLKLLELFIK